MTACDTLALLRRLEWSGRAWPTAHICPECLQKRYPDGRHSACGLNRLIRQTEADVSEVDRLRAAIQRIADTEPRIIWFNDDNTWCEVCEESVKMAREALEGKA